MFPLIKYIADFLARIEHLPASVLPLYAPVLLGVYHPRHLLITTPSYTFNARWTAPGITERSGYPDPTGRTNRVFRHHDHKFEWTIEEFEKYCEEAALEWGYEVATSTVGRSVEKDPWDRDEECAGASQVAEFTRKESKECRNMREVKAAKFLSEHTGDSSHTLMAAHRHPAHPSSQRPIAVLGAVGEAVKQKMILFQEASMRFEELWFEQDISTLCGGWIELLLDAVEADEGLFLKKDRNGPDGQVHESARREDWSIELVGADGNGETLWRRAVENTPPAHEVQMSVEDDNSEGEWDEGGESRLYEDTLQSWSTKTEVTQGWGNDVGSSEWGDCTAWSQQGSDVVEKVGAQGWGGTEQDWDP